MWRLAKKLLTGLIGVLIVLAVVIIYNTLQYKPVAPIAFVTAPAMDDPAGAAQKLSEAVRMRTVRFSEDELAFRKFLDWLPGAFPDFHRVASREMVAGFTPLYRWEGSDPALKPVLLAAHYDVVDADEASLDRWTHPPFSGDVVDGFVWGRGSLDNKGAVVAIFEAAELLSSRGFQPRRTIYFSIGHDEEIGGEYGAAVGHGF